MIFKTDANADKAMMKTASIEVKCDYKLTQDDCRTSVDATLSKGLDWYTNIKFLFTSKIIPYQDFYNKLYYGNAKQISTSKSDASVGPVFSGINQTQDIFNWDAEN